MNNNVTYVFSGPRRHNYINDSVEAKEFYYGVFNPAFEKSNIKIIEFKTKESIPNLFLQFFDKVFAKLFSLPFYTSKLTTLENFRTFKNSSHIFLINENVGCSALLLLLFLNKKGIKISMFVMGLYSKRLRFRYFKFIHYLLIKILVSQVDFVHFLGKGEFHQACNIHPKLSSKFNYFPFSIDTEFWSPKEDFDLNRNNNILFVGNDGNRDTELLLDIAKALPNYQFIFVSKIPNLQNINLPNVKLISGSWGDKAITDNELKKVYNNSRLTIIPLKESSQPSGQSVALQSMSIGIPVLISKTSGFWDEDAFINNVHLFIQNENNPESWSKNIENLYKNIEKLESASRKAKLLTIENFNLGNFYKRLESYL
tara:strand:- start:2362 stop:3471 length:1110 start_codon:yes stop_codon:yes gene_type:complete